MKKILIPIVLILGNSTVLAQISNTTPWPGNPPVGIGTQLSVPYIPQNALHIHHDPTQSSTLPAILRLSDGGTDTTKVFGTLALMPTTAGFPLLNYSNLAKPTDLILHENDDGNASGGDLILANFSPWSGAIRMSTTPTAGTVPTSTIPNDLEHVTILRSGNIGIDIPPDISTGLCAPLDQVQIGGGSVTPPSPWYSGYTTPIPGLTIYGGNRFEGMTRPDTLSPYPVDWRGISFNHYENHMTGMASRFAPMPWDQIALSDQDGGLISLGVFPWHTGDSLTSNDSGVFLQVTGQQGLSMFSYQGASDPYHHYFDVWRPGFGGVRNINGLFYHHTPVYIGGSEAPDFTNFAHVTPDIGDGKTWMLAVNGAALAKEFFVLDSTWADYVFDPCYKLPSLGEVENFVKANHHLPDVPSASQIAQTGVPIGRTEAALTKNVEELTLYVIEQNKKIEQLEEDIKELKNQKER